MSSKKYDARVTILKNEKINEKYYKLVFKSKNLSRNISPGQFINVQISPTQDFFLRRPFSYYRITGDHVEVLYEVLGKGTSLLSERQKGDALQIMGPLGKAFTPSSKIRQKKTVLVAGGVGVPPLLFLAERFGADYLLIGTKSKAEVLPRTELAKVKAKVLYSTNDGSYGKKGFVTNILEDVIHTESAEKIFIQTCGPQVMMNAVMDMAGQYGIEGEASLDEDMACGVGACLGCMVKTHRGWVPSCVEGPVFEFCELDR